MRFTALHLGLFCLALSCAVVALLCFLASRSHAAPGGGKPTRGTPASVVEASPDAYKLGDGPHKVQTAEFDLHDDKRGKDLPLKAYAPADGGPYPLIIFSHGAGGSRDVAPGLLTHWASYGYVVVAPTHEDSVALKMQQGTWRQGNAAQGARQMDGILMGFGTDPQVRIRRVDDISLIIDKVDELPQLAPTLKGKIDATHIGLGGHSAGAMTASLVGGAKVDMPFNGPGGPESRSFKDKRINALLLLSGQGITGPGAGFNADSWKEMTLPTMVESGSFDNAPRTRQTAASRRHPYEYAPPDDKYLVFIDGALHMSFTGRASGDEPGVATRWLESYLGTPDVDTALQYDQHAIFDYVKISTLAFWDTYLKDDPQAKAWLQSDRLSTLSRGQVEYKRK